jgi:TRAP transporter TAXI family solute receptor
MNMKAAFRRPIKDIAMAAAPFAVVLLLIGVAYKFIDPAPPKHLVISTGEDEGDYQEFAKQYVEIMKEDGVTLEIRPSSGAMENFRRLKDPKSDVGVAFMQDGLATADDGPDLSSLGSLYYEPVWIFYRGSQTMTRLTHMVGKRIAVGQAGGGTQAIATRLLKAAGVTRQNATFVEEGAADAVAALKEGRADAAMFIRTPEDPLIAQLISTPGLHLMSMDQAEAITRRVPFLHHLTLPHGTLDLARGLPDHDVELVAPTATLLVKDTLHPALTYLLLKAISQVHEDPGIFEKRGEFPINKDDDFPLAAEAKRFYKSGAPFWQRYLPFWLATLVERFIFLIIPAFAVVLPMLRSVPRFLSWRMKNRLFKHYGELKFLEARIRPDEGMKANQDHLRELDRIEEKVNNMRVPLDFTDQMYVLREHIDFVRRRLERSLAKGV